MLLSTLCALEPTRQPCIPSSVTKASSCTAPALGSPDAGVYSFICLSVCFEKKGPWRSPQPSAVPLVASMCANSSSCGKAAVTVSQSFIQDIRTAFSKTPTFFTALNIKDSSCKEMKLLTCSMSKFMLLVYKFEEWVLGTMEDKGRKNVLKKESFWPKGQKRDQKVVCPSTPPFKGVLLIKATRWGRLKMGQSCTQSVRIWE